MHHTTTTRVYRHRREVVLVDRIVSLGELSASARDVRHTTLDRIGLLLGHLRAFVEGRGPSRIVRQREEQHRDNWHPPRCLKRPISRRKGWQMSSLGSECP